MIQDWKIYLTFNAQWHLSAGILRVNQRCLEDLEAIKRKRKYKKAVATWTVFGSDRHLEGEIMKTHKRVFLVLGRAECFVTTDPMVDTKNFFFSSLQYLDNWKVKAEEREIKWKAKMHGAP